MANYKTIATLKKELDRAGVTYTETMSQAELQALVDALPESPARNLAASLPTEEMNTIAPEFPSAATPDPKEQLPAPEPLEQTVQSLREEIKNLHGMIRTLADKDRLAHFDNNNKQEIGKIIHVSTYNEKVVIGWSKMTHNTVQKIPDSPHSYLQTTKIFYADGSSEDIDYVIFHRDKVMIKAIVEEESYNSKTQATIYKVSTKDYGSFEIDVKFVN